MSAIQQVISSYGGSTGDPYWSSVVALLHFDGTDASTTFTDQVTKTWTANGNAQLDTAQFKFGTASGLFDGTGDYITTPDITGWTMGTGDFTIEGWTRWNNTTGNQYILGQVDSAANDSSFSFAVNKNSAQKVNGFCYSGTTQFGAATSTTSVVANQWYSWAYVRSGTNFYLFLDGVLEGTNTSSSSVNDSSQNLSIGRVGAFNAVYTNGWIDEVRITKGVARYTSTYTPSTTAFPNS